MRVTRMFTALAAVTLVGLACKDDTVGIPSGVEIFIANLNAANERPTPVTTAATGRAVITVLGNLVSWKVDVVDIDSVTIGHIHKGVADSAGGVIRDLAPTPTGLNFTGTVAVGSATVVDSVLTLMRAGRAYVNIHTKVYPGGEIRGQTVKQ
ncbi:MAG TPA: CHRD domain-containing protein [Gemmatimonadales bacterium]|nr:CHRD domain-containing protein [Gemmatimonadales bacterium]